MNSPDYCSIAELARRRREPTAGEMLANLTEIGSGLERQFALLQHNPTPSGCQKLSIHLGGAARIVMKIRAALMADDQCSRDTD